MQTRSLALSVADSPVPALTMVEDWYDLAAVIKSWPRTLAYALKHRDALQKRIRLGERVVYQSGRSLKSVQLKLIPLLDSLYEQIPTDHMLAYIKGKDPRKVLGTQAIGSKYEVTFDIRKYYDNITFKHLTELLQTYGATPQGAKLIARYCVVKRQVNGKQISTLQQGSPVSPLISNLIGYHYIDRPIMDWLQQKREEHPKLEVRMFRYSDNVALFLYGEIPLDFVKEYRAFVWGLLPTKGFFSHKWNVIPANHPKMNQKFLGMVLNKMARIEKDQFERLRATAFNAATQGLDAAAAQFFKDYPFDPPAEGMALYDLTGLKREKFLQILGGKIAYIHSINRDHSSLLRKLKLAAELFNRQPDRVYESNPQGWTLRQDLFDLVKGYRNVTEAEEVFLARLEEQIHRKDSSYHPVAI